MCLCETKVCVYIYLFPVYVRIERYCCSTMYICIVLQIGPKDVCGCPMDPLFPATHRTSHRFCTQPKRMCTRHYSWEKVRKAEIDQEKLNLVLHTHTHTHTHTNISSICDFRRKIMLIPHKCSKKLVFIPV